MSMSTNPGVPLFPAFNPYSLDPSQILASMQNNALTSNIYEGTAKAVNAVNDNQRLMTNEFANTNSNIYEGVVKGINSTNDTQRLMTSEFSNVNKNIFDTIAQNAVAIERNGAAGTATSERVGYQVGTAVERNGANAAATAERVGSQVGVSVERNGGNIMSAIERVAGEGRLTTTIVDAASRQASNDSARDIIRSVDRTGLDGVTATKDSFATILQSIERNAGETRLASAIGQGATDVKLTDVRHSVLNDVNRTTNEVIAAATQNFNVLNKAVTDAAWENRSALSNGFQNISEEHLRTKFDIANQASTHHSQELLQSANNYASLLLEDQKNKEQIASQSSKQYSSLLLEDQKNKEQLASQASTYYASQLLEAQKNKADLASHSAMQFAAMVSKSDGHAAGLAKQMDNHYASILLEQQKSKELISLQLHEAKYEALKHKMELSKEMGDCCCEIKQKVDQRSQEVIGVVDTLDRNRLRDEVNTTTNENSLLKFAELGVFGGPGGYGGYGGYGGHGHDHGRGSRGRGRRY